MNLATMCITVYKYKNILVFWLHSISIMLYCRSSKKN